MSKPSAAERQYLREHAATLLGPRMSVVTRDDLMAFLKAKVIGRIRIGLAVYYNVTV